MVNKSAQFIEDSEDKLFAGVSFQIHILLLVLYILYFKLTGN